MTWWLGGHKWRQMQASSNSSSSGFSQGSALTKGVCGGAGAPAWSAVLARQPVRQQRLRLSKFDKGLQPDERASEQATQNAVPLYSKVMSTLLLGGMRQEVDKPYRQP